jgi:hypothetical protein
MPRIRPHAHAERRALRAGQHRHRRDHAVERAVHHVPEVVAEAAPSGRFIAGIRRQRPVAQRAQPADRFARRPLGFQPHGGTIVRGDITGRQSLGQPAPYAGPRPRSGSRAWAAVASATRARAELVLTGRRNRSGPAPSSARSASFETGRTQVHVCRAFAFAPPRDAVVLEDLDRGGTRSLMSPCVRRHPHFRILARGARRQRLRRAGAVRGRDRPRGEPGRLLRRLAGRPSRSRNPPQKRTTTIPHERDPDEAVVLGTCLPSGANAGLHASRADCGRVQEPTAQPFFSRRGARPVAQGCAGRAVCESAGIRSTLRGGTAFCQQLEIW